MLAAELDEWGIELSADEIEGFDEVERVGGEAAARKPRKDRAGGGRGAKDAIGKSGKSRKARGGDRITHGGRRKGASKPVDPKNRPGGGVRRAKPS